jgi:hypothetical protein
MGRNPEHRSRAAAAAAHLRAARVPAAASSRNRRATKKGACLARPLFACRAAVCVRRLPGSASSRRAW